MNIYVEFEEIQQDILEEKRWKRIYYIAAITTLRPACVAAVVRQLRKISGVQIVNYSASRKGKMEVGIHVSIEHEQYQWSGENGLHAQVVRCIHQTLAGAYELPESKVRIVEVFAPGETPAPEIILRSREPTPAERQAE